MYFGLFLTLMSVASAQNMYCSISTCSDPSSNTMCKYNTTVWGSACSLADKVTATISAAERDIIVNAHNEYRRFVAKGLETRGNPGPQAGASNMRKLMWDPELAEMAQTLAQQCVFAHDTCRNVPRFQVGQNLYMMISSNPLTVSDWQAAVKKWYDEVDLMDPTYVTSLPGYPTFMKIGHYTQVVWATTYTVGCGVASFQDTTNLSYKRIYVCNYGPTGNFIGSAMYKQGAAGTACQAGTVNQDGLCA